MLQFFDQIGDESVPNAPYRFCPQCGHPLPPDTRQRCTECGFVRYRNPSPGVSILIPNEQGALLVGRRARDPHLWCLPCGYIEWDESFLEAAHREVKEETGLTVRIESVVNVVTNYLPQQFNVVVVVLLARPIGGEPIAGDDIVELAWVDAHSVPPLAFDSDHYIMNEFFERRLAAIPADHRFATRE